MKLNKKILLLIMGIFLVLSYLSAIQNYPDFSKEINTDLSERFERMERDSKDITISVESFCLFLSKNEFDKAIKSLSQEIRPRLTLRELTDLSMDKNSRIMQCETLEVWSIDSEKWTTVFGKKRHDASTSGAIYIGTEIKYYFSTELSKEYGLWKIVDFQIGSIIKDWIRKGKRK